MLENKENQSFVVRMKLQEDVRSIKTDVMKK